MNLLSATKKIPESVDALLIVSPENRFYFTDFPSSDGVLLVTANGGYFFTDSRYLEAAQKTVSSCEVKNVINFSEDLKAICSQNNIKRLGIEASRMTVRELRRYREILPDVEIADGSETDEMINSLREVKSSSELKLIKKAQKIAESAFEHILGFIKPGVSEKEIALELDYYMLRNGADAISFETIAVSGAKSSMPHGVPDENKVQYGDFVTMDFGAVVSGYHSDMTRTVAVGQVSDKQRFVYNTVLDAQKTALEILAPEVPCKTADAAARDVITKAGFGAYFGHSTGHGVGVEIHEMPNLSPKSEQILSKGNVVTVEPGIYLPNEFGVRIEDMAVITDSGCENLTSVTKELIVL